MIITFNELRKIKDKLPNGSMKKIADRLEIDEDTVRNYFGGSHYKEGEGTSAGIHIERGVNGGFVKIEDERILEIAKSMIQN
tara:strand:+ start:535 stop:780 length:246 start_codon:yes stop_codon:yes gene_type:complete